MRHIKQMNLSNRLIKRLDKDFIFLRRENQELQRKRKVDKLMARATMRCRSSSNNK
jgi:hypothetical protein